MGGNTGEIQLGSERELYKYINHHAVVTKASSNSKNTLDKIFGLLIINRSSGLQ